MKKTKRERCDRCGKFAAEGSLFVDGTDESKCVCRRCAHPHQFGPQEPPQDARIYNRRRADGTYPSTLEFFDKAARDIDGGAQ